MRAETVDFLLFFAAKRRKGRTRCGKTGGNFRPDHAAIRCAFHPVFAQGAVRGWRTICLFVVHFISSFRWNVCPPILDRFESGFQAILQGRRFRVDRFLPGKGKEKIGVVVNIH
jgi:hypothetical protein